MIDDLPPNIFDRPNEVIQGLIDRTAKRAANQLAVWFFAAVVSIFY